MDRELGALLDLVSPTKGDIIVPAGDLVNKGPHSAAVVRRFRMLRDEGFRVEPVLGNHDDMMIRFLRKRATGQKVDVMRRASELAMTADLLDPEDIEFLHSSKHFFHIPEHGAIVVHAGITPGTKRLIEREEFLKMSSKDRSKFEQILRVRYVRADAEDPSRSAKMVEMGTEVESDEFWAEVYDGRFGHVYFGHEPHVWADKPVRYPHATALDLGCVFGGRLAAVVLAEGRDPESFTVKASQAYGQYLYGTE
jgi:hypothetical protein